MGKVIITSRAASAPHALGQVINGTKVSGVAAQGRIDGGPFPVIHIYKLNLSNEVGRTAVITPREVQRVTNSTRINWGLSSSTPAAENIHTAADRALARENPDTVIALNPPYALHHVVNKSRFYKLMGAAGTPSRQYALDARRFRDITEGRWFVRTKLTGHSGEGIEIYDFNNPTPVTWPDRTWCTPDLGDRDEYRVHFCMQPDGGMNTLICKKRRRDGMADVINYDVRNLANGWVYSYNGTPPRGQRLERLLNATRATQQVTELHFGAVDIVYLPDGRTIVLEVNTAPGLNHTETATFYRENFNNWILR